MQYLIIGKGAKESALAKKIKEHQYFSDIDWNKDIPAIDAQLYDKYQLTLTERSFIEKMITPFN